jgi:hypothetical protein
MEKLAKLLMLERDRSHISSGCKYPTALEMIRCGIGANYGGEYYQEVLDAVLEPILKELDKDSGNE